MLLAVHSCLHDFSAEQFRGLADKLCGQLNDAVASTLNQVVGKLDVVEGRMQGSESSGRTFIEKSTGLLREHVTSSATASNALLDQAQEMTTVETALKTISAEIGPLVETLKGAVGSFESLAGRVQALEDVHHDKAVLCKWKQFRWCC